MRITFQKQGGDPEAGIEFFWRLALDEAASQTVSDLLIPELYFDFFYVRCGGMWYMGAGGAVARQLPPQLLRTIHTRPLTLTLQTPLTVYGARLTLSFAELYWAGDLPANALLAQEWVTAPNDLEAFAAQVSRTIADNRIRRTDWPLVSQSLEESDWLAAYSPRHKRRLYRSAFGVSRRELESIRNVHRFLGQSCEFDAHYPRIADYVNTDVFYDQPHLNSAFKRLTGLSPLAYFETGSLLQDNLLAVSYNESAE